MNTQLCITKHATSKGFTLLEAMVALLIFSIGLLGLAGLQAGGLQNSKTADMRSIAVIAAHDMAERIRANQPASGITSIAYNGISAIPATPTSCITANCTSESAVAAWDAYEWETNLSQKLPSGIGSVTSLGGGAYRITVMWDEANTGATKTDCGTDPKVSLKCYILDFQPS